MFWKHFKMWNKHLKNDLSLRWFAMSRNAFFRSIKHFGADIIKTSNKLFTTYRYLKEYFDKFYRKFVIRSSFVKTQCQIVIFRFDKTF